VPYHSRSHDHLLIRVIVVGRSAVLPQRLRLNMTARFCVEDVLHLHLARQSLPEPNICLRVCAESSLAPNHSPEMSTVPWEVHVWRIERALTDN
jgi:hypothetical protein